MRTTRRTIPAVVAAVFLLAIPVWIFGYGNDGPGGGPHRRLNALALDRFIERAAQDPVFRFYDFRPTSERYGLLPSTFHFLVLSTTVTKAGAWHRGDRPPGVTSSFIEEGDVLKPFAWWVEEGGFTADEPESFMALRHFYDPLARGVDAKTGKKAAYLTDALDPYFSPLLMGPNPQMDAKTWAVSESPYSFLEGQGALEYIAAMDFAKKDRVPHFGKAWRSLGEALHLLADMTVPAHVRNDAHPGPKLANYIDSMKTLKGDPYEDYVDAAVVSRCAAGPAPEAVRKAIEGVTDPGVLLHRLALWTNRSFFSNDTISGRDGVTGGLIEPANGQAAYPAPKLESYRFEPNKYGVGYYNTADRTFTAADRNKDGGHVVGSLTVTDQALVLIPAAVEAEVALIDMFMPRLKVAVEAFEAESGTLHFRSVRLDAVGTGAGSVSGRQCNLWSNPNAIVFLTAGKSRRTASLRIEPDRKSGLWLNLSDLLNAVRGEVAPGTAVEASCVVGLDMGGILVKSAPFGLSPLSSPPPADRRTERTTRTDVPPPPPADKRSERTTKPDAAQPTSGTNEDQVVSEYRSLLPASIEANRKPWHTRIDLIANAVKQGSGYRVSWKTYCLIESGPDKGKDYLCFEYDTVLDIMALRSAVADMKKQLKR
jgi:hypothetical protein